ncbi:MarR family winged helix-turn-helix transcriptional regulator [Agromyces aurantiacus]|uniref:MarR family winged helix-turn-helix transcriptional regulator n=1 Tax=Agromyces aurantiacus TaxID=165814 RepID=A0ABV9R6U0_9MICO|nr:MarR family winged helix-turn-helix transcriptional regulator [Agromyces aurantiacus]MBM7502705.1 DNA-binding MarR family transcriptional regulator [Agromyces aurantiacus]
MTGSDPHAPEPDPVELIERSLAALRHGRPRGGPHPHGDHHHGHHPGAGAPGPADRGARPAGGRPWGHGANGEADAEGRAGGPPWPRRGSRGAWEFRVGPVARFRLLATLDAADRPLSVTELAEAIGVDQPRASRLVQAAADEGQVVREADPDDARRTRIRLTEAGSAAVRNATSTRRQAIEAALEGFTDVERAQFATLLARFARGIQERRP